MNEIGKLETKTFPFELEEKALDEVGTFEGYAAIFGKKDRIGEIIEKGAFTKTLQENKDIPLLWHHDPRDPIGVVADIKADSKGLKIRGQLNLEVKSAQEKYSLMKQKAIRGLSFGYRTIKDHWGGRVKSLLEINLFEFSPVTFQMHPDAQITSVKEWGDGRSFAESLEGIIEFLNDFKSTEIKSSDALDVAVKSLTNVLKGEEPLKSTPALESLYDPIVEALGKGSEPQPHLLNSVFEALGNN